MAGAMRKMGVYLGLVEEDPERFEEYDEYDEYESSPHRDPAPERAEQTRALHPVRDDRPTPAPSVTPRPAPRPEPVESYKITTLHPRNYNDARTVGEYFRDGTPVIMNLTDMDDSDAKRLVDFSAGLIFGLHGTIERVTAKVFLLSPANVVVTAEEKARLAEGGFFNQS
ncbi:MAG: cell division protein SepF [Actinomycetes bacterium]